MTREEEIRQAVREYADVTETYLLGEEMELVRNAYEAGAEWADGHPINPWHTVAYGDFPKKSGDYLCSDGEEFIVAYYSRASRRFHNILERYGGDYDDWIKYWMEIPILQDKMNTSSALSKMER